MSVRNAAPAASTTASVSPVSSVVKSSAPMSRQVYIAGKFFPQEDAKISVFDHGLLYGDGIFEGIRAYNGRVFKLDRHIDRLFESAKALRLDLPLSRQEFEQIVSVLFRRFLDSLEKADPIARIGKGLWFGSRTL